MDDIDLTEDINDCLQEYTTDKNAAKIPTRPKFNYLPEGDHQICITKTGAFVKFSDLTNPKHITKIANYFKLQAKQITGHIKVLACSTLDKKKDRLIIPRFGIYEVLKYLPGYTTVSQIAEGDKIKYEWKGTLNGNQELLSSHIMENYFNDERKDKGSSGLIVNLEAGQGKSFLAAYIIGLIGRRAAVILHSESLVEQWAKVLQSCYTDLTVGYYYGKKKKWGDIMLMIVNSAGSSEFKIEGETLTPLEFFNKFGIIVYDECHLYANIHGKKVLKIAQAPYVLGLSATPDEHLYGWDQLIWWYLGPVMDAKSIPGYSAASEEFTALVHKVCYYGPETHTRNITTVIGDTTVANTAGTINMVCDDMYRNLAVLDCITKGLKLDLNIFVFADRREYLEILRKLLLETQGISSEVMCDNEDYVRIVGGAASDALEQAETKSKVIFTTYPYMGTGKSIKKMNGLVLATPRKSKMKQYVNRIFRLGSDATIQRHIWDVVDMKLNFRNQYSTRKKYYLSKGYNIEEEKVRYEEIKKTEEPKEKLDIIEETSKGPKEKLDTKKIQATVSGILKMLKS